MTRAAVVTIVHGRHEHLRLQHRGLMRSLVMPDDYVVVAMDDPALPGWNPHGSLRPRVVAQDAGPDGLGLSAARNAGAEVALEQGADLLVFLDVDCIPSASLVGAYVTAFERFASRAALLCGPVAYLPTPPADGYDLRRLADLAEPHPSRPAPLPGVVDIDRSGHDLFWSLSFAVGRETWGRIGGFDERFVGYGGEDTDFAHRAGDVDVPWRGWAAPARSTSTTRSATRPSSTSPTSCATGGCSATGGAPGRCRAGSTRSWSWDWSRWWAATTSRSMHERHRADRSPATTDNGVLSLVIPLSERAKPRRIRLAGMGDRESIVVWSEARPDGQVRSGPRPVRPQRS